jgi:hypothetical protein
MIGQFTIYILHLTFKEQLSIFKTSHLEFGGWKLLLENSLKIVNCKLKNSSRGGKA